MKSLQVLKIETCEDISVHNASLLLENLAESNKLEFVNWKEYPYKPFVAFRIVHADDKILLKFYVTEKMIRAMETEVNGSVYLDSCVEFFLSVDGLNYYNFEFNCIGITHVGWGIGRHGRKLLPPEVVRSIQVKSSLGDKPFDTRHGNFSWNIIILIPSSSFLFDQGISFSGLSGTANFYKCGSALPEQHYLTWNPVNTPGPDYHRPEYFGQIDFE